MTLVSTRGVVRRAIRGILRGRRTIRNYLKRRRISMFRKSEYSITLCLTFCASAAFRGNSLGAGTAEHDGKGAGQRDRQHLAIGG
jgi:hypothetical protein